MEMSGAAAQTLLSAVGAHQAGAATVPAKPLVRALASLISEPEQVPARGSGVSWVGPDDEFNSMLIDDGRIVHARVRGEHAEAAMYGSPVDTLEVVDTEALDGYPSDLDWLVRAWRVTLLDGTVITLHAGDQGHPDRLAAFVLQHLQPKGRS